MTVQDAFSRYELRWAMLTQCERLDVRRVIPEALEKTGAKPRIMSEEPQGH